MRRLVQKCESMQAKPRPASEKEAPPSPIAVLLLSLFGYPGLGHFMVKRKSIGMAIIVGFTMLTIGLCYEMYVLVAPILKMYTSMGKADSSVLEQSPNWLRILFWLISTTIVWLGSGFHAFQLAQKLQGREVEFTTPKPQESDVPTDDLKRELPAGS